MSKKKIIIISIVLVLTITVIFFLINIFKKVSFNNYIENTTKYFKEINYNTNINLSINSSTSKSELQYSLDKTKSVVHEEYYQYVDDKLQNHINNYYVTKSSGIKLYTEVNGIYNGENIQNINTIFDINYSDLKNKVSNVKYLGKENIDNKKYLKYSVKMKVYDIYNIIYKENILTSKDNNNSSTLYIYIDKDLGLVYKIDSTIDNLNNTSYDANKLEYKIEIINTKLNNNKAINLPFNENN